MSSSTDLRRRLTRPLVLWPTIALALELVIQHRASTPRWLALLPLVPMLLFIVELARTINKMDELQQRISLTSMAIAFILTLFLTLLFIGLERMGLFMPPWSDIGTYMLLLWGCAYFVCVWRYR